MRNFMKIFVNLLTTFRFLSIIVLTIIFHKISREVFLLIIAILFLTDLLDGYLARKYRVQTMYGTYMDTIADKALSLGLIVILLHKVLLLWLVFVGDVCISFINIIGKLRGKVTQSSLDGKMKTWFVALTILISYAYYFHIFPYTLVRISCILTFVIQLFVITSYVKFFKSQGNRKVIKKEFELNKLFYYLFSTEYYFKNMKKNTNQVNT